MDQRVWWVSSAVEHLVYTEMVGGSTPSPTTRFSTQTGVEPDERIRQVSAISPLARRIQSGVAGVPNVGKAVGVNALR